MFALLILPCWDKLLVLVRASPARLTDLTTRFCAVRWHPLGVAAGVSDA